MKTFSSIGLNPDLLVDDLEELPSVAIDQRLHRTGTTPETVDMLPPLPHRLLYRLSARLRAIVYVYIPTLRHSS